MLVLSNLFGPYIMPIVIQRCIYIYPWFVWKPYECKYKYKSAETARFTLTLTLHSLLQIPPCRPQLHLAACRGPPPTSQSAQSWPNVDRGPSTKTSRQRATCEGKEHGTNVAEQFLIFIFNLDFLFFAKTGLELELGIHAQKFRHHGTQGR